MDTMNVMNVLPWMFYGWSALGLVIFIIMMTIISVKVEDGRKTNDKYYWHLVFACGPFVWAFVGIIGMFNKLADLMLVEEDEDEEEF